VGFSVTAVVVLRAALSLDAVEEEALASLESGGTALSSHRGLERDSRRRSCGGAAYAGSSGSRDGWLSTALAEGRVATSTAMIGAPTAPTGRRAALAKTIRTDKPNARLTSTGGSATALAVSRGGSGRGRNRNR
jgi:hypothetical protein